MQTTIARCGTGLFVADGERWTFGHQPGTGGNVLAFVLGLVGVVLSANAVAIAITQNVGALALLVLGLPLFAAAMLVVRRRNARRASDPIQPIVTLDFSTGMLLDATGGTLAPLTQVAFAPRMQLASSARALECHWQGRHITVLRGDAFGGSIGPALNALRSRGLRA